MIGEPLSTSIPAGKSMSPCFTASCTKTIISVILFSQDGDELYVSEATIRAGYIKHMKDERKAPTRVDEFVKVQQFGPYWIQLREDMQYFAKLVLAVALRASQEEATSVSEHRLRPREAC